MCLKVTIEKDKMVIERYKSRGAVEHTGGSHFCKLLP